MSFKQTLNDSQFCLSPGEVYLLVRLIEKLSFQR